MAATTPSPPAHPLRGLRRTPADGLVAGVCSGLAQRIGIDPLLLRVAFAATTVASGIGIVAYVLAWVLLPADVEAATAVPAAPTRPRRAAVEVALGSGLLLLALLLSLRELGLPFSDALTWPLVLVGAGGALLWRQSLGGPAGGEPPGAPADGASSAGASAAASGVTPRALAPHAPSPAVISRIGVGITLVLAAAIVFLQFTGALSAATDVALAALVAAIALGVIFAPWIVRLLTSLTTERAERIRSQERAEVAAHLHDSVLQTLALVQKRAADPRAVAALARRQERE
ncbi:MAG: PspC domain-containing protein, partial [Solirubrobacterales bacterium]|nr:PspC domain-containing protein [Solirubrobacterales bacterium]